MTDRHQRAARLFIISAALASALCFATTAAAQPAWPDLERPGKAIGGGAKDAAVIVGIDDYWTVTDVPGADSNARAWTAYLHKMRSVPLSKITLLQNKEGTRESIEDALDQAASRVAPGGTLWFVFVGHGAASPDGKDGVLVGADVQANARSIYARSVSQSDALKRLARGRQAHTIVVLDTCFSGVGAQGEALAKGLQPLVPVRKQQPKAKLTMFTAGKSTEFAGALPGASRPAFSYLLLGALRGWGDSDKDRKVSAQEALDYTHGSLQFLLRGRRSQNPQLRTREPAKTLASGRALEQGPDIYGMVVSAPRTPTPSTSTAQPLPECAGPLRCPLKPEQYAAARAAYDARCRRDDQRACNSLGYMTSKGYGVSVDASAAATLVRKACDSGVMEACTNLGAMHRAGYGVRQDSKEAVRLFRKACDSGDMGGCSNLGIMLEAGQGVRDDVKEAARLYRKACDGGYIRGCSNLGVMYNRGSGVRQDPKEAARFFRKACDNGDASGCFNLGVSYALGAGVRVDLQEAAHLQRKACDDGYMRGCASLGVMHAYGQGARQDAKEATRLYRKACDGEDTMGCAYLGIAHENGQGVRKDIKEAVRLFRKACGGGFMYGCTRLGILYEQGKGVRKDIKEADQLYRKACQGGDSKGCERVK